MVSHKGQETDVLSAISLHFLSLPLTRLCLRIPTAAETIIYVSVVNVKEQPLLVAVRKNIGTEMWPLVSKKSRVLGGASKINTENTSLTHIYLHHLTTALTKAP